MVWAQEAERVDSLHGSVASFHEEARRRQVKSGRDQAKANLARYAADVRAALTRERECIAETKTLQVC